MLIHTSQLDIVFPCISFRIRYRPVFQAVYTFYYRLRWAIVEKTIIDSYKSGIMLEWYYIHLNFLCCL
jgi:hypothetical protein